MHNITDDKNTQVAAPNSELTTLPLPSARGARMRPVARKVSVAKQGLFVRCLSLIKHLFAFTRPAVLPVELPASIQPATAAIVAQLVQVEKPVFRKTTSTLVTAMGDYAGKPSGDYLRQLAEKEFMAMDTSQVVKH